MFSSPQINCCQADKCVGLNWNEADIAYVKFQLLARTSLHYITTLFFFSFHFYICTIFLLLIHIKSRSFAAFRNVRTFNMGNNLKTWKLPMVKIHMVSLILVCSASHFKARQSLGIICSFTAVKQFRNVLGYKKMEDHDGFASLMSWDLACHVLLL